MIKCRSHIHPALEHARVGPLLVVLDGNLLVELERVILVRREDGLAPLRNDKVRIRRGLVVDQDNIVGDGLSDKCRWPMHR